ncbi:MAG: hypothetical protein JXJ20_13815 [Anaerolineae bacterium]|nr:hypothetical protein [Anaerolineae bacterium]
MSNSELTWILLAIASAASLTGLLIVRRRTLALRPIPAYVVLQESAADAVESDNQIHFSMGSVAPGQASTISALTAAEIIYRLGERLAISPRPPLITFSDPLTLPLAQDTLRRAYEFRQKMQYYRSSAAAWYPQGPRALAYAAGAASLSADVDAHSNVLLGRFGIELALFGESSLRHEQVLIAHSDLPEGQAIAYVQADQVLLGEELYVGPAYMKGRPLEIGGVLAQDVLRWAVILGILIAALQAL